MKKKTNAKKKSRDFLKPSESRRGFIRVDFEPGSKVAITEEVSTRNYDALDLSVYGLSFLVPQGEAHRFYLGRENVPLGFDAGECRIEVLGKVAYLQTGLVAGLSKVAVEFTQIAIEDVWHLSRHLAERAGLTKAGDINMGIIELTELKPYVEKASKAGARKKKGTKKAATKKAATKKAAKKATQKVAKKATKKAAKKVTKKTAQKTAKKTAQKNTKKRARR